MSDVTPILSQIETGDPSLVEHLLPLVYDELRKLARTRMANERIDHTSTTTTTRSRVLPFTYLFGKVNIRAQHTLHALGLAPSRNENAMPPESLSRNRCLRCRMSRIVCFAKAITVLEKP